MAKSKVTPRSAAPRSVAPTPAYSPGYTWMLLFSVLAMAGGCALLYIELTEDYEFKTEPQGVGAVPKLEPLSPRDQTQPKLPGGAAFQPDGDRAAIEPATEPTPINPPVRPARPVGPVVSTFPTPFPLPGLSTR